MGPYNILGSDKNAPGGLFNYFGGIARAVLGRSLRFAKNDGFFLPTHRQEIIDITYNNLMEVAQDVPHLNIVISRGAEMFSNMKIKHVDKDDKEIVGSPVMDLLNKPNPLQNLEDFLYDYYIYRSIYSTNFCYKNYGSRLSELPSILWWLPPGLMQINLTGKMYRQYKLDQIIENYKMLSDETPFEPKEIIHFTDGVTLSKIKGGSKIFSLQIPLSNIMAALKSNNIILTERGLIGFIGSDISDTTGLAQPLTDKQQKEMENKFQSDRSLDSNNSHVVITKAALKWNPMTFKVNELMLYDGLEDSFGLICGAYGIDRSIFPPSVATPSSLGNSQDKEMGLKSTIQNTMQPIANQMLGRLGPDLGVGVKGDKLIGTWEDMPVMQQDAKQAADIKNVQADTLGKHLNNGVISHKQYADIAELKLDGHQQKGENDNSKNKKNGA